MKARSYCTLAAFVGLCLFAYGCPAPDATATVEGVTGAGGAPGQPGAGPSLMARVKDAEVKLAKAKRIDVNKEYADAAKADPKDLDKGFLDAWTKPGREDAELFIRESIDQAGDKSMYHLGMGAIYYEWKVNDRAMANIAKALTANPANYLALYYKGLYHLRREEFDDALAGLQKCIEIEPTFPLAHIAAGRVFQRKKDLDKAIAAFQEANKQDPKIFDGHYILGQLLGEKGKGDEAIAELATASELNPDNLEVQMNLAKTFDKLNKLDEAIAAFERAAKIKPNEAEVYVSIAKLHQKKKDKDKEFEAWERAVKYDPRNVEAHLSLAWLALDKGQLEKAEKGFQEAARKKTDDHMIYVGLGRIAVKREDYRRAMEQYRRALRIESASKEAKEELGDIKKRFEITTEPITGATLEKAFGAYQQKILKAFKVLLKAYPKIKGKVTIQVAIDNEGAVTDAIFEENTVNHPALEACILGNALMVKFPAGKKGKVNYTMNFDPALAK